MMPARLCSVLAAAMICATPAALAQSVTCPAAPAVLPFAPPAGPMRFVVETDRPVRAGGVQRFGLEYRVQFHPVGRAHGLTVTLVAIDSPRSMRAGDVMTAIFSPIVGRPLELLFDADAHQLHLSSADADALWQHFADEAAGRAQAATPGEARLLSSMLLDLPVHRREQMLFADLEQMLQFAGRSPQADPALLPGESGAGCRLMRLVGNGGSPSGSAGPSFKRIWQIDLMSGLVEEQREEVHMQENAAEPPRLAARTIRRLRPE